VQYESEYEQEVDEYLALQTLNYEIDQRYWQESDYDYYTALEES
jgi:hypothetical protein